MITMSDPGNIPIVKNAPVKIKLTSQQKDIPEMKLRRLIN